MFQLGAWFSFYVHPHETQAQRQLQPLGKFVSDEHAQQVLAERTGRCGNLKHLSGRVYGNCTRRVTNPKVTRVVYLVVVKPNQQPKLA